MIEVSLNRTNKNYTEQKYVIDVFFTCFLCLDYRFIDSSEADVVKIILPNNKKIILEDHFFKDFSSSKDYLSKDNIPESITFISSKKNQFLVENDLPVIYGTDTLEFADEGKTIICGLDVFASAFFMLARWEEYVYKMRDEHNRFPAESSLAYKHGFLNRPVVNEYAEMLWRMISHLSSGITRGLREFTLIPTHDVDVVEQSPFVRRLAGDLLKRKDLAAFFKRIKIGNKNEFNTFEWLMDESEKNNLKSRFYFMSGGTSPNDNFFIIEEQKKLLQIIADRGHIIGFHPSYNAYNDVKQFNLEKERLEAVTGNQVFEGRQHFLRFSLPETWQIWEQAGMEIDSSMSFAGHEGFRCGTADEFPVFDIINHKVLKLKEQPLIIMDGTLRDYRGLSKKEAVEQMTYYKNICNKYNMPFTILFHNSSFSEIEWEGWKEIYSFLLQH